MPSRRRGNPRSGTPQARPQTLQPEPGEVLYEAYSAAKSHRMAGPGSAKLKHWHELGVDERRAWRAVSAAFRMAYMAQDQILVPALPSREQIGVYVMDPDRGQWRSSTQAYSEATGTVRDMRDVVAELFTYLDEDTAEETQ